MSIIIKGMEMPKSWRDCPFSNGAAQCKLINMEVCDKQHTHRSICPLVSVTPHGDLIDLRTVNLEDGPYEYQDWVEWALEQYQNAPVFIPADKEGEV